MNESISSYWDKGTSKSPWLLVAFMAVFAIGVAGGYVSHPSSGTQTNVSIPKADTPKVEFKSPDVKAPDVKVDVKAPTVKVDVTTPPPVNVNTKELTVNAVPKMMFEPPKRPKDAGVVGTATAVPVVVVFDDGTAVRCVVASNPYNLAEGGGVDCQW